MYSALNSSVLVLNKYYMAIQVTSARRAFSLLIKDFAEVVSLEDESYSTYNFTSWVELSKVKESFPEGLSGWEWVKTVSFDIRVPKIIRLLFYDKLPRQTVKFNRKNLFARDENRCQYCGKRFSTSQLSLDHVIPRSRGGTSNWHNIVCCCHKCNVRKGGRSPEEAGLKLIKRPVKPKRNPFIQIGLSSDKFRSWQQFLDNAYWTVELQP